MTNDTWITFLECIKKYKASHQGNGDVQFSLEGESHRSCVIFSGHHSTQKEVFKIFKPKLNV